MYVSNNSLVPDPELEPSILTSKPREWFWMKSGIRMSSWSESAVRFYMLGNPVIWWLGSLSIIINIIIIFTYRMCRIRKNYITEEREQTVFEERVKVIVGAWAFNYLPFFAMGRVTYTHHYYPALVMSILSIGILLEHIIRQKERAYFLQYIVLGMSVIAFLYFSPFSYGMQGPLKLYAGRKILKSWNIV